MAPEHDARMRAFYDHELDEQSPGRRRRAAADWGVGEDIFDRMPSRRFTRADRRAEHRDEPAGRRFERRVSGPAQPHAAQDWDDESPRRDDWSDAHERRQVAPRRDDWADERREVAEWGDDARRDERTDARRAESHGDEPRRGDWNDAPRRAADWHDEPRRAVAWHDDEPRRGDWDDAPRRAADRDDEPRRAPAAHAATPHAPRRDATPRRPRRPAESWTEGVEGSVEIEGKRPIESWLEPERGESRTIVLDLGGDPEPITPEAAALVEHNEPTGRRTVVIKGQPDRLPVPRTQRPPRTAVERIGARPDRIVGYAVALGFLLVLIAVLTTGQ